MKFFLLAGVAAATLMAQAAEAVTFSYTGSIVQWIVPTDGRFRITASGAQGGSSFEFRGGRGVTLSGVFSLTAGQQIDIAVGGMGGSVGFLPGGGGGGTFVMSSGSPLLIAGGGGGAFGGSVEGMDANSGTGGTSSINGSQGGQGGQGGYSGSYTAGGSGAGLLSGGTFPYSGSEVHLLAGQSFPTLAGGQGVGGGNGGFGGGGGGGGDYGGGNLGGGGGGGFSGGGGGYFAQGGGGGSFNGGTNREVLGFNTGDGSVSIASAVPEPSIWSMLISGFGLVGLALRRRLHKVLQGA